MKWRLKMRKHLGPLKRERRGSRGGAVEGVGECGGRIREDRSLSDQRQRQRWDVGAQGCSRMGAEKRRTAEARKPGEGQGFRKCGLTRPRFGSVTGKGEHREGPARSLSLLLRLRSVTS